MLKVFGDSLRKDAPRSVRIEVRSVYVFWFRFFCNAVQSSIRALSNIKMAVIRLMIIVYTGGISNLVATAKSFC
jgi:hypothetical protein